MSIKFLTGIDLSGCELLNAVVQNLATAPSSPSDGFLYYDTTIKKYRGYSNGGWIDFGSGVNSYTKTETDNAISTAVANIVNGSPDALNTLKELSDALGADANFASTISTTIGNKVDKISGKGLSANDFTTILLDKLNTIADGANNYTHPSNHSPSIINQDGNNRFVTDAQISDWGGRTKKFTASIGNGSLTTIPVTHGLNSREVIVSLTDTASPYNVVMTDMQITSVNVVTLFFATAPTNGQYTLTVIG